MKNTIFYALTLSILLLISFSTFSCKSDTNPVSSTTFDANSVNGTITFVDSTFTLTDTTASGGFFSVSAFATWPAQPTQSAIVNPVKVGSKWQANYKITGLNNGSYTIAFAWIKKPYNGTYFLGIYDTLITNDTLHNVGVLFGPHPNAVIANNSGVGNFNFLAFLDTARKIYKM